MCRAADNAPLPSEIHRFSDAATEFTVFRLTDSAHQSWLPASYGRAVSRRNNFLIYANDRSGSAQAYRMDLKSGESRLLTEADGLVADSLTLTPDERNFCYVAGRSLFLASLAGVRAREVYRAAAGFDLGRGLGLSDDGLYAALVERKPGTDRLRLIAMRAGTATTLAESNEPLADPMPRPRRTSVSYRRGKNDLALVNFTGAQNRTLRVAPGTLGSALWSTDGRTILYLNFPLDPKQLHALREFTPDSNEDRFVSATSQFVTFNHNGDSSVLVGASGSKASPYVLLLVRSVKRELTLCEHRASDPQQVTTLFSPNSQRIFFQSDRDGKMAIYSMAVDRLVEETDTEADQN
jgi:oligogalacturonide lyase